MAHLCRFYCRASRYFFAATIGIAVAAAARQRFRSVCPIPNVLTNPLAAPIPRQYGATSFGWGRPMGWQPKAAAPGGIEQALEGGGPGGPGLDAHLVLLTSKLPLRPLACRTPTAVSRGSAPQPGATLPPFTFAALVTETIAAANYGMISFNDSLQSLQRPSMHRATEKGGRGDRSNYDEYLGCFTCFSLHSRGRVRGGGFRFLLRTFVD